MRKEILFNTEERAKLLKGIEIRLKKKDESVKVIFIIKNDILYDNFKHIEWDCKWNVSRVEDEIIAYRRFNLFKYDVKSIKREIDDFLFNIEKIFAIIDTKYRLVQRYIRNLNRRLK